jgi:hypothetical protein
MDFAMFGDKLIKNKSMGIVWAVEVGMSCLLTKSYWLMGCSLVMATEFKGYCSSLGNGIKVSISTFKGLACNIWPI